MFERKKLGLIQPNLQGKLSYQGGKIVLESPTSRKRKNDENQAPVKSARKDGIYEDPATPLTKRAKHCPLSVIDAAVQTEQTPLTPSANFQAATRNETSFTVASTSSNDYSGSLISVSAPQITEKGSGTITPIQSRKAVSMSAELKISNVGGLSSTSKATESELKTTVKAHQSVSEKEQMSPDDQATIDMLISEEPGNRYWEMIAAERKAALIDALSENKQLYQRNSELQDKVHHLKQENTQLNNIYQQTKIMMDLYQSIVKEEQDSQDAEQLPSGTAEEATPLSTSTEEQAESVVKEEQDSQDSEQLPSETAEEASPLSPSAEEQTSLS